MAAKTKYDRFVALALKLGAKESKVITAASIITAPWVRLKCQFGCGGYNSTYCCPPHTPGPEQTRSVIDSYRKAVLVHCTARGNVTKIIIRLEREIFLAGYYKALGFGSGPCSLCRACPVEGCKHPEKARPSMEACGIDVYATARGNGYPIEVVKDDSSDQNYYGVVLIE